MRSLNKVILIGRVVKEPEFKEKGEIKYARYTVVTSKIHFSKKHEGGKKEYPSFHFCISWGRAAEFVRDYLAVGSLVSIDGELNYNSWLDREGKKVWQTQIMVERLVLLARPTSKPAAPAGDEGSANEPDPLDGVKLDIETADEPPF